ncbi:MAG TPA: acetyl-CoA hydrolase/transferase C-terminal domain-containing protein [Acidimicrobiales bacterium]|nr:acetyl-CoA hydrolase/transferase C-terminal domain-containing protein [Acidimicrobiales bacterium]
MHVVASPSEAAAMVRPTDTIGFGLGPAIPDAFMTALGERDDWVDLVLGGALMLNYYNVCTHQGVSYRCGFFGPAERLLLAQGHHVEHVPGGFRQFGPILSRYAPRIMTVQGSPPDEHGSVNLSLHQGATRPELLKAGQDPERLLIVEVNPNLPRTSSLRPAFDNTIPLDLIDVLVEADSVPFALEETAPDDVDTGIARAALSYVTNGSTLQTGIGTVPNIVASELASGPLGDFGIHSEMFTTGLMRLHQSGKVTNSSKGLFDGVSVTTFALGSRELYGWLDGNDQVVFIDVDVVNDPSVIGQNKKLVSINGALSVDLYGQVVADSIDGRQVSGVGGHEDFVAGAELHTDAHSLICLRSTALVGGATVSRIAPILPAGSIVSTPRHHTSVVVTEYGAVELAGLTVRERAHALVDIAHPDFRRELRSAADGMGRR